jgi:hypothetical protein
MRHVLPLDRGVDLSLSIIEHPEKYKLIAK